MNFGWVNISSQLILPNGALLLSASHVLFFFPVYVQHSTSKFLANCGPLLQGHSEESNPGTFLECRKFFEANLFRSHLDHQGTSALQRPLCTFSVCFVGSGQSACSSLPLVFSNDQASPQRSRVFCSDANFIVALTLPSLHSSAVCPESHSFHLLSSFLLSSTRWLL